MLHLTRCSSVRSGLKGLLIGACVFGTTGWWFTASDRSTAVARDGQQRIIGGTVASSSQFKNVGVLKKRTFKFCTGTVIAPTWVLTASHCVEGISPSQMRRHSFEVGGRAYNWSNVYIHPTYSFPDGDIALIKLKTAIPGTITPATLRTVAPRVGESMTIVGFGLTGTGATGTTGGSGVKRFGTVILDDIEPFFVNWDFDAPELHNTAPGDSGGPGFIDGSLASVTSGGSSSDAGWGDTSFNTRVDAYLTWIRQTMTNANMLDEVPSGIRLLASPKAAASAAADLLPEDVYGSDAIRSFILDR